MVLSIYITNIHVQNKSSKRFTNTMASRSFSGNTNSYSFSMMNVDEDEWVKSMCKSIIEDVDEQIDKIPVCIFTVPKVLLDTDPGSYIPQKVALGPFHHWRPEVYDMQRYKLAAARRTHKRMNVSFARIVEMMKKEDESQIRACYHTFLDMSGDALVWMLAVDTVFLLEFLQFYSTKDQESRMHTLAMSHVIDVTRKKLFHMAILRDLVMVENQIPLFLIKTMLEHQLQETDNASVGETLKTMLMGLYHEFSPFHDQDLADVNIDECDHLLDFLYQMTVPNNTKLCIYDTIEIAPEGT